MDSLQRFSDTVENYIKYRPGYPKEIITLMEDTMGMEDDSVVADVGSGTGKLTQIFLDNENLVYGIEPNQEMRKAAERLLDQYDNFSSISGTAEETTLEDQSVDFVVAGQAYHWFKPKKFKEECLRILPTEGWVILIWNDRVDAHSDFMESYESFLQSFSTDYKQIDHRKVDHAALMEFFGESAFKEAEFSNKQIFDWEGLQGRYLSCSYAFKSTDPEYTRAIGALKSLFEQHQSGGFVTMDYLTRVYYGQIHSNGKA